MKTLLCALLLAAGAAAQNNPGVLDAPLLGLVFDPDGGTLRPLVGIPASAHAGAPLDSGAALRLAAASAAGYAIGVERESGAAVIVSASGRHTIDGVPAGAGRIALSPLGTEAVFYFEQSRTAYVIAGLPNAPQVARQEIFDREPTAIAVSDDEIGRAHV